MFEGPLVQWRDSMRRPATLVLLCQTVLLAMNGSALAQDEPRPIGRFALDLRGSFPGFPSEPSLAESRGLDARELPGRGLGADAGVHLYLLTWKAVTVGIGGQVTVATAHASGASAAGVRPVTTRFTSMAPQLSLNFGGRDGWSYVSVGRGTSTWSIVPEGEIRGPADRERLRTFNYGGGARWFAQPHLAFTFDVRFWEVAPGTPHLERPGSPRTTLLILSAGISVK
jgi:hypothetical protein